VGKEESAYNGERKSDTENESIETHDPGSVLSLDNPGGKSDTLAEFLLSIGVTIELVVVAADFVGEAVGYAR
jgi:hypothetical protein